jgi:hypothetical protein
MINFASKRNLEDLNNYYKILNLKITEIENSLLTLNWDTLKKSRVAWLGGYLRIPGRAGPP